MNFCYNLRRKKVRILYGNLRLFRINFDFRIIKIGLFRRIKELFKSNQNRNGVYHVYLDYKTKRIFAIACVGKKLVFHTEICDYFDRNNRKFPYENLTFFLETL